MVGLVVTSACRRAESPLSGTADSPEELANRLLEALASRDRAALDRATLSEQEFRGHVWPQLPASRPERNLPFSYVWGDLHQKSDVSLERTLVRYGGRRLTLASVTFGDVTDYKTFTVHRAATFVVQDEGGEESVRLCGSMIQKDGRWKVFSYVTED